MKHLQKCFRHSRWSKTIAIRSVVVVDIATRIDIPSVISIASISTAQTNVLRL